MEWVETTAKTLDEARELALDQLGVGADDAEFDVLEEPKPGLFGRVRGEARIRARVRPTQARPKQERKRRSRSDKAPPAAETVAHRPPETSRPTSRRSRSMPPTPLLPRPARPTTSTADKPPRPSRQRSTKQREQVPAVNDTDQTRDDAPQSDVTPDEVGAAAVAFMDGLTDAFGVTRHVGVVDRRHDVGAQCRRRRTRPARRSGRTDAECGAGSRTRRRPTALG